MLPNAIFAKKQLKEDKVHVSVSKVLSYKSFDICEACGKPILAFIHKKGLLKEKNNMPNLTNEDINAIVEAQKQVFPAKGDLSVLKESLDQHSEILEAIIGTLNKHTTILDALAKNTKEYQQEAMVSSNRLERMEDGIKKPSQKIGLEYKV